ncbi:undecaprenyl-phosphate glucose phosphotransferase [soil metagenome]
MRNESGHRHHVVLSDILTQTGRADHDAGAVIRAPLVSPRVVTALVRCADFLIVTSMGAALWFVYVYGAPEVDPVVYPPLILGAGVMFTLVLHFAGHYSINAFLRPSEHIVRLAGAWILTAGLILTLLFFMKSGQNFSRVWVAMWFAGALSGLTFFRLGLARLVRRWNAKGQLDRRAVLIGGGEPAQHLIEALEASRNIDISIAGIFDDRDDDRSPNIVAGCPKLGTVSELIDFSRRNRVDLLIVTFPIAAETRLLQILKRLWVLPVDIRLSAYSQRLRFRPRSYSYIGNVPFLDVFDKPLSDWGRVVKHIEDKIIASLALALFSPVMLLIAITVRLDSKGPLFFRQRRFGFNNELIEVYKFRSMYVEHADAQADKLVTKGDPRVTRTGRFLRKTSLDELPQLFNVLRGELSLVGPRPHATHAKAQNELYTDVVEGYFARHKVKPGITGWAQINGWRGETNTVEKIHRRVEHDLYYIENWSVMFDLYILLRTPFALLETENAY